MLARRPLALLFLLFASCGSNEAGEADAAVGADGGTDASAGDSASVDATAPVVTVVSSPTTLVLGDVGFLTFRADVDHDWRLEAGGQSPGGGLLLGQGSAGAEDLVSAEVASDSLGVGAHSLRLYVTAQAGGPTAGIERDVSVVSSLTVLLLYGYQGTWDGDMIRGALANDLRIGQVTETAFSVVNPTPPALATLQAFDVVVYWWNDVASLDWGSRASLGNRLADYVDAGGAIVTIAYATGQNGLLGRAATEAYLALRSPASGPYTTTAAANLGTVTTGHPILEGVSSITVGVPRPIAEVDAEATLVASWSDGHPLAAIKGRIVGLGLPLFAADAGLAGEWALLLGNAITLAAAQGP